MGIIILTVSGWALNLASWIKHARKLQTFWKKLVYLKRKCMNSIFWKLLLLYWIAAGITKYSSEKYTNIHYRIDRKSTRLNSSHVSISYAVFCLKKKIK